MSLLEFTERGIYCQRAGVFVDPWKSVPRALITHAHSDHARAGCQHYLCTPHTAPLLRHRIGSHQKIDAIEYGSSVDIHGVRFSFHPAGHIVGSAQIRVEYQSEVWVVSGDYKRQTDGISEDFEPVKCHTFITETTFALPIYRWPSQKVVFDEINTWWENNSAQGISSVISAYSLGKAQRIIQNVDHSIGPIYCHESVEDINRVLRNVRIPIKPTHLISEATSKAALANALIIVPGSVLNNKWISKLRDYSTASASGWMMLRGRKKWQSIDRGFVLSDHVDWDALNQTVKETECERVVSTHGYSDIYTKWLREQGYQAMAEKTFYEDENSLPLT